MREESGHQLPLPFLLFALPFLLSSLPFLVSSLPLLLFALPFLVLPLPFLVLPAAVPSVCAAAPCVFTAAPLDSGRDGQRQDLRLRRAGRGGALMRCPKPGGVTVCNSIALNHSVRDAGSGDVDSRGVRRDQEHVDDPRRAVWHPRRRAGANGCR